MTKERVTRMCSVENCERELYARERCRYHYNKARLMDEIPKIPLNANLVCTVDGCEMCVTAKGLCNVHYRRQLRHGDVKYIMVNVGTGTTLAERFWSRVALTADDSRCWEWVASRSHGYGVLTFEGKTWRAPKCAWFLTYGVEPTLLMLHHCDNPACVNPKHLYEGTQQDNINDMIRRNRNPRWKNKEEVSNSG